MSQNQNRNYFCFPRLVRLRQLADCGLARGDLVVKPAKATSVLVLFTIIFIFGILFSASPASAAGLVPPCGGTGQPACKICDIWILSNNLINFALKVVALPILVVVLVVGGFMFVTGSNNPKQIEQAKSLISAGVIGIIIAFLGWLIVDTVVKTLAADGAFTPAWNKINECPSPIQPAAPNVSALFNTNYQTDAEARAILITNGIRINKPSCLTAAQTNCTDLSGIPKSTVNHLVELQRYCVSTVTNCRFVMTGGTEAGHLTHAAGEPVVDIAPFGDYVVLERAIHRVVPNTTTLCEKGRTPVACNSGTADHIHVVFPR